MGCSRTAGTEAGAVWGQKCNYLPQSHPHCPVAATLCRVVGAGDVPKEALLPQKLLGFGAAFTLPAPSAGEADTHETSLDPQGSRWGIHGEREDPSPGAPGCAEQLWGCRKELCLCVIPAWGVYFSSPAWLTLGLPLPALPSVSLWGVPVGDVPSFPRLPQRDTEPWGCSSGRGTERFGKRFGKGSLKGSVQGQGAVLVLLNHRSAGRPKFFLKLVLNLR